MDLGLSSVLFVSVVKLVHRTLTDSWLNSNVSTLLHSPFTILATLLESKECHIFFSPLIYFFSYLMASWGFTLLHQHKNMAAIRDFFPAILVFQTTCPTPDLMNTSHIHSFIMVVTFTSSVVVAILDLCCHLAACHFLIPHLPLVLHRGDVLAFHLSRCCLSVCWLHLPPMILVFWWSTQILSSGLPRLLVSP